ncbi:hypothetical protein [Hydrogenovibrio marinus]|uniref:hypothetical protein n=1 Tax=Hydrogenovibrio marinus TaxID=28885 RepID=UPI0004A6B18F|nr:hypothetical protein [Hydrogenovibrio marinus]
MTYFVLFELFMALAVLISAFVVCKTNPSCNAKIEETKFSVRAYCENFVPAVPQLADEVCYE